MANNEGKSKGSGAGMAAAAVALTAIAGAAGAILANRELRDSLGKKTVKALDVVSKVAMRAEEEAVSGLKALRARTGKKKADKKPVKKIKVKAKKAA